MSTKNIRRALEFMRGLALTAEQSNARVHALAEVEAIEKAARVVSVQGIFELEEEPDEVRADVEAAEEVFGRIAKERA
jgi:ribosomal protein S12 methylthiotransferase accessory factor YcaO